MKALAFSFFILCISCALLQDNIYVEKEAMIAMSFIYFLCGINVLMIIKSSSDETPPPRP
jgi:hypothetical protein